MDAGRDDGRRKGAVLPGLFFTGMSPALFIVGMANSAPSLTPARAPAAEGEDAQRKNPSATSSSAWRTRRLP